MGRTGVADTDLRAFIRRLGQTLRAGDAELVGDDALLERFLTQHDQSAFELLVWRHAGLVLGVCHRVLAHRDVEDAFQATFLTLARKAASIGKRRSLSSWLYKVAYRAALTARVRGRKGPTGSRALDASLPDPCLEPSEHAEAHEVATVIDAEINRLPEKLRLVFILRQLEGKTNEEAARELGCPVGTVDSRLARARERLRLGLRDSGLALTSVALAGLVPDLAAANSHALIATTVSAARRLAEGEALKVVASETVVALTNAVCRTLFWTSARTAGLLTIGVLAAVSIGLVFAATSSELPPATANPGEEASDERPGPPARPVSAKPVWRARFSLEGQNGAIWAIAFAPDQNVLATGGEDRSILLWDLQQRQVIRSLNSTGQTVRSLQFSQDQRELYAFEDKLIRTWDLQSYQPRRQFHSGLLGTLALSPGGKPVFAGNATSGMGLLGLEAFDRLALVPPSPDEVVCAVSPEQTLLAMGRKQGAIRLWDIVGKKVKTIFTGHQGPVTALTFSPDGRRLASGGQDGQIKLWDASAGLPSTTLDGHAGAVWGLAFAPDGRSLVSGSADQTVKLWQAASGQELARVSLPAGVQSLAWSGDGKSLAVGGMDHRLTLWDLED